MNDLSFRSFQDFFQYNLKKSTSGKDGKKILTYQELSRKIGIKSTSLFSMIAKGKRLPSPEMLELLFDLWNTEKDLREIIRVQIEIEKKIKKNGTTSNLIKKLSAIDKKGKFKQINIDAFNSVKDWHLSVLLQLISTPDFIEDFNLISRQLKKKVTPAQARKGIETLLRANLIKRNKDSLRLELVSPDECLETPHDIPSEAIRDHHRGMILRALDTIDEDAVYARHLNSMTLKFNSNDLQNAKAAILNFIKEFNTKFYDGTSNDIYQFNIQFFEHTNHSLVEKKLM